MSGSKLGVFTSLALALTVSVVAHSLGTAPVGRSWQSSPTAAQPAPQATSESASPRRANAQRQTPCWRVAGIAPQLVNQRWHIEHNAEGKISAVCTEPTLSAEKRREKIQEINLQAEQEIAKIIPAKQLEAFKACQAQRDQEKPKRQAATAENKLGPCGGVIPEQSDAPQHPH